MAEIKNGRRLKIVSDGTKGGTRLLDAETGEPIGLVQSVEWHVDTSMALAEATVKLVKVPVEVEGVATVEEVDVAPEEPDDWGCLDGQ